MTAKKTAVKKVSTQNDVIVGTAAPVVEKVVAEKVKKVTAGTAAIVEKNRKTQKFYYRCDPGHGWMVVERKLLEKLGIISKISSHSYQRTKVNSRSHQKTDFVYLEEDNDLPIFIKAMQTAGVDVVPDETHANRESKIRQYEPFAV